MHREVFHFRTVAVSYDRVRRFMRDDPDLLFSPALDGVAGTSDEIGGLLEVDLDGIVLGADVTLQIGEFEEVAAPLPLSRRRLGWHATRHTPAFPILEGELEAFPVDDDHTQVTFTCHYRPPLKAFGAIADTVFLHRVADECLDRFFNRVIACLEAQAMSS